MISNIDVSADPHFNSPRTGRPNYPFKIESKSVIEIKSRKVGIIGLLRLNTRETSNIGSGIKVQSALREVENDLRIAIGEIQRAHPDCNIIVLLSTALHMVFRKKKKKEERKSYLKDKAWNFCCICEHLFSY